MQVPQWVKPGFWGVVIGAIGIMIVGFGWLGWTLGSTADSLAQERVNTALVAAFTPICVEKFMTQPDATVKLTEFQKTSSWRQQELVEKGGWATLPGSKEPNRPVRKRLSPPVRANSTRILICPLRPHPRVS